MNPSGGGNYPKLPLIPAGNHVAILYSIVALGTQEKMWEGRTKYVPQAQFTWEIPGVTAEFEDNGVKVVKPRVIGNDYTLSAAENAALRKMIESWRGAKFTDAEAVAFDFRVLLGRPCLINITHTVSKKDGKTYANIGSVTPMMQGIPVPALFNPITYLEFENWDWNVYGTLPRFIREKIERSPEFGQLVKPAGFVPANAPRVQVQQARPGHQDGLGAPQRTAQGNPVVGWAQPAQPTAQPVYPGPQPTVVQQPAVQQPAAPAWTQPAVQQQPVVQQAAPVQQQPAWPIPDSTDEPLPF